MSEITARIWVTRDETPDGPLCRALGEAGLEPVCEPVLLRQRTGDARDELSMLTDEDWLVLTSVFSVECLADLPAKPPRIAAVGPATAEAIRSRGWNVDLETDRSGEDLWAALRERAETGVICYPRSSLASPPEAWADVVIVSPAVYETRPRDFDPSVIGRIDWIAVTSPSAVHIVGPSNAPFASIGPTTTAALREIGITPRVEAARPTFGDLAREIADHVVK
ncbi:MAG: uroporphyrinogen-III synthase [Phycisphaerales bacterium]|nr:MAG: uroporphyrinogen-III synthase [Phycisphaerales bacterium]